MGGGWMPWRRFMWVWLPPVLLLLVAIAFLAWQNSGTLGREAQLSTELEELQVTILNLERIVDQSGRDLEQVAELDAELQRIYVDVFGDLDQRLTNILREVEKAARGAQMLPAGFAYSAEEAKGIDCIRFEIAFAVEGRYDQIRMMLAALQSSSQFLTVQSVSFRGEDEPVRQEVRISVVLSTYLAEADPEHLRLLTSGRTGFAEEATDG